MSQSVFEYIGEPQVLAVDPASGTAQDGGTQVTVIGSALGRSAADVRNVTIGGIACSNVELISRTTLRCVAPAHFGKALDVVVTNALGLSS